MRFALPQSRLDSWFRIGVLLKALDGTLEVLGAILLIFVPIAKLQHAITAMCVYEIQEDNHHAFIASFILHAEQKIDPRIQLFAVVYLLLHGLVKVGLSYGLYRQYYHFYPYAIGFLIAFGLYQVYEIGYNHSVGLTVLTLVDAAIAWLTYLEWKRHQKPPVHV
jgi:uncharacterized membrane protein